MCLVNLSVTANFCRQGCYLLSSFCKRASWEEFLAALAFTHYHWHEATMGPRSPLNVFNHAKESYDIDLSTPDVGVTVAEKGSWDQDGAIQDLEERKKALSLSFRRMEGGVLVVSFVMEMKEKVSESLEDLAAETVAKQMASKSHIEILEFVAKTQLESIKALRGKLFDSIKSVEWVQSHRLHIEEDKRRQLEVQDPGVNFALPENLPALMEGGGVDKNEGGDDEENEGGDDKEDVGGDDEGGDDLKKQGSDEEN